MILSLLIQIDGFWGCIMIEQNDFKKYSNKKLLIITPAYPNEDNTFFGELYVKNQLESVKKYFREITVIAPVLFSFKILTEDKLCKNYHYDNIKVYYPRAIYIPIFYFSKILIDNRLRVVEKLIKKEKIEFDLIHAHFTWPSAYIGVKLKERFNRAIIATIHENSGWFNKEINMSHPLLDYTWKSADALIRVNKVDVPRLKNFNKNVYSIPNGFSSNFKPMNKNECRSKLHLPMDKRVIFALGGLMKRKGLNYLIDAMKIITERRKDVLCFIGSTGPLKDKLQKQINELNLQDCVKLIGFVPDELLPIWMNASDLYVLPSLAEGNPTSMFEVLGCGKPFVGTRVGGIPEIITNEKLGYIVEPKDVDGLVNAILEALGKDWDREYISNYAKQFSWDEIAKKIFWVYNEVYEKK